MVDWTRVVAIEMVRGNLVQDLLTDQTRLANRLKVWCDSYGFGLMAQWIKGLLTEIGKS